LHAHFTTETSPKRNHPGNNPETLLRYGLDTRAEIFRAAAQEYQLIGMKIKSKCRVDELTVEAWAQTWKEVDLRVLELQKKLTGACVA